MRTSTLYIALAACVASVASATYTNGDDFFNDLPTCIKDCNTALITSAQKKCDSASNSLECVCDFIVDLGSMDSTSAAATDSETCSLACSEDDQNTLTEVVMDMATSCVPYIIDTAASNSTSVVSSAGSSMSGMAMATSSPSSTGGSGSSSSRATATGSATASETPSGTAVSQAGAAGRSVVVNGLFVAVPALLAGLLV